MCYQAKKSKIWSTKSIRNLIFWVKLQMTNFNSLTKKKFWLSRSNTKTGKRTLSFQRPLKLKSTHRENLKKNKRKRLMTLKSRDQFGDKRSSKNLSSCKLTKRRSFNQSFLMCSQESKLMRWKEFRKDKKSLRNLKLKMIMI